MTSLPPAAAPAPASAATAAAAAGPHRRSVLALASCLLAVLPPVCLLSPVLGALALRQMRRNPSIEGRPLAWAGLVLGSLISVGFVTATVLAWQSFQVVVQRPEALMQACMAGNPQAVREQMIGAGAEATAADVAVWGAAMRQRWGALVRVERSNRPPDQPPQEAQGQVILHAAYTAVFEKEQVPVMVVFASPKDSMAPLFALRILRLELEPADGPRIVFPAGTPTAP